jgi:tol-pal system protein YbgF
MRTRILGVVLCLAVCGLWPSAAGAQNREHLQMTADLRMLQEQVSKLQITANLLGESLRAINKRIDDDAAASQKTFADLQALIGSLATTVNTVREKVDDNTVRVQELKQELPALRSGLSMVAEQLNTLVGLLQPPINPSVDGSGAAAPPAGAPSGPGAGATALGGVKVPDSPNGIFDAAMADYMSNHLDNAVDGFNEFLQKYADAPNAPQAQFQIGMSYYQQGKFRDALTAYGKVISQYGTAGEVVQDAYYQQGLCYIELNQRTEARRVFQEIVQKFPGSTKALLAQQKLANLGAAR